ncbi:cytochrome P450 3A19-like [Pomacea canaliculata]|uniref:cytochrome P450 3A19-like n=1 Tax=Pomacea canaliculata TaxID=400727 RepID=UPI000D7385D9|nr:cytochrome P450 3A19-like [Pomacea canaliculata]
MDRHVNRCCGAVSRYLQRLTDEGQLVHVKQVFGAYSLDVIAGTAFGMETDFLTNQNDAILQAALNISGKQSHLDILQGFLMVFPILRPLFSFLSVNESSAVKDVIGLIESLIHDRKNNSQSERADFLQLMLDAEASEAEVAARPQDKHMTKVEIIAQGITILLGGYDTTATTLQYLTYLLALNPDRQEKLYHEIIAAIGHAAPTYNNVMSIKYLDNCVWEALRCFPPAVTIIRVAAETRTIKGVLIPAGICIAALLYVIMQDEENFPEPHRFIPERFDDNSIPTLLRELAFGAGPRQCLCMRLALYEAKMVAVTLIRRFRFIKVPETPETISLNKFSWMSFPDKPIFVRAEARN